MTDHSRDEALNRASGIAYIYHQNFTPKVCNVYLYMNHDSTTPDSEATTTCELYILPIYPHEAPGVLHDGRLVDEYIRELTHNLPHRKIIFQCPRLIGVTSLNGHNYTYHKINNEWQFMVAVTTSNSDSVENLGSP